MLNPGGVTSIYTGTGCAIFWGAFFQVENKFWGIIFGKIIHGHKFWGIIFSMTINFVVNFFANDVDVEGNFMYLIKLLDFCPNYGPIIRY